MVKITGDKAHRARLAALTSPEGKREIQKALYAGGQILEIYAERSITAGSVSGKDHKPSYPGMAPNADTRQLDTNIETTSHPDEGIVRVTSNAPYSAYLEFGTSKMRPRPFMRPAAKHTRRQIVELVAKAVSRIARRVPKGV